MTRLTVEGVGLDPAARQAELRAEVRAAAQAAKEVSIQAYAAAVPRRTGRLAGSVDGKVTRRLAGVTVTVGPSVFYAGMVEDGTVTHEIQGRRRDGRRGTLRTPAGPRRRVHHPGARPVRYLNRARAAAVPAAEQAFELALGSIGGAT